MSSLIKLYGEFWNPDAVEWGKRGGNRGELFGSHKVNGAQTTTDFWDAQGIYVLYDNFKSVYVGKAFDTPLGKRIRDHLTDRLAGRWDMFSWYSTSTFLKTTNRLKAASKKQLAPETIVDTLEALAILIADPVLNRKRESIPHAVEIERAASNKPQSVKAYLESILSAVSKDRCDDV